MTTPPTTPAPTPECDAEALIVSCNYDFSIHHESGQYCDIGFARRLERERDEARAESKQLAIDKISLIGELAEARAENKRLREALKTAKFLIIRHHDSRVQQVAGCFCPVCHHDDGTTPEIDQMFAALAEEKGGGE